MAESSGCSTLFRYASVTRPLPGQWLMRSGQNIGALAAYPFAPYLSDGIGRRLTIWIGATIMLAAVAVQSAATTLDMFIAAR